MALLHLLPSKIPEFFEFPEFIHFGSFNVQCSHSNLNAIDLPMANMANRCKDGIPHTYGWWGVLGQLVTEQTVLYKNIDIFYLGGNSPSCFFLNYHGRILTKIHLVVSNRVSLVHTQQVHPTDSVSTAETGTRNAARQLVTLGDMKTSNCAPSVGKTHEKNRG